MVFPGAECIPSINTAAPGGLDLGEEGVGPLLQAFQGGLPDAHILLSAQASGPASL